MKHKVSELDGALLDQAVAKAEGHGKSVVQTVRSRKVGARTTCSIQLLDEEDEPFWAAYQPSSEWGDGGPIIEREAQHILKAEPLWVAFQRSEREELPTYIQSTGPTLLIAAMRCYVASKFGDEVEL